MIIYTAEQLEKISKDVNLLKQSSIDTYGFVFEQLKNSNIVPDKETMMNSLNIFSLSYLLDNYELDSSDKAKLLPFFASSSTHSIIEESTSTKESAVSFLKEKKPLYRSMILDYDVFCAHTKEIEEQFDIDGYTASEVLKNSAKKWGYKKIAKMPKDVLFGYAEIFDALNSKEINSDEIKPLFKEYLSNKMKEAAPISFVEIKNLNFTQEDVDLLRFFIKSKEDNFGRMFSYDQLNTISGASDLISKMEFFEKYNALDFTGWTKSELSEHKEYIKSTIKNYLLSKSKKCSLEELFRIEGAGAEELSIVLDSNFIKELLCSGRFYISNGSDSNETEYLEKQKLMGFLMAQVLTDTTFGTQMPTSTLTDVFYYISNVKQIRAGKLNGEEAKKLKNYFDLFFNNFFEKSNPEDFSFYSELEYLANVYSAQAVIDLAKKNPSFNKIYLSCNLVNELGKRSYDNSWAVSNLRKNLEEALPEFSKYLNKQEYDLVKNSFSERNKKENKKEISFPSKGISLLNNSVFLKKDIKQSTLAKNNILNIEYDYLLKKINDLFEKKREEVPLYEFNHYDTSSNQALKTFKWLLSCDKKFEKKILKSLLFKTNASELNEEVLVGIYSLFIKEFAPNSKIGECTKEIILKDKKRYLNYEQLKEEMVRKEDWLLELFDQEDLKRSNDKVFSQLMNIENHLIDLNIKNHNLNNESNAIYKTFEDKFKICVSKYGYASSLTHKELIEKYEKKISKLIEKDDIEHSILLLENLKRIQKEEALVSEKISLTEKKLSNLKESFYSFFIKNKVEELLKDKDFESLSILLKSSFKNSKSVIEPIITREFNSYSREELLKQVNNKFWRHIVLGFNNVSSYDDTKCNFKFKLNSSEEYKWFIGLLIKHVKEPTSVDFLTKESWADYSLLKSWNNDRVHYIFNVLDDSDPHVQKTIKEFSIENFLKQILYSYDFFYTNNTQYRKLPLNEPFSNDEVVTIFNKGVKTGAIVNHFDVNARVYEWIDANYRSEHGRRDDGFKKNKKAFEALVLQSRSIPMLHVVLCSANILRSFAMEDERVQDLKGDEAICKYSDLLFDKMILIEGVSQWLDYASKRQKEFNKLDSSESLKAKSNHDNPHELDTNMELVKGAVNQVIWSSYYDKTESNTTKYYSSWSKEESIALADVLLKKAPGIFLGLHCLGSLADFPKTISDYLINNKFEEPLVDKLICYGDEYRSYGLNGRFSDYYEEHLSSLVLHCLKHQDKNQLQYIKTLCDNFSFIEEARIGIDLESEEERKQKFKLREFSEQLEFATGNEKFMQMLNSVHEVFQIEGQVAPCQREEQRLKKVKSLRL